MASDFDLAGSFIPALHRPSSLLPIARHRQSLLYLIETFPITIVVGQTGSGKTTQIPQFLEQAGVSFPQQFSLKRLQLATARRSEVFHGVISGCWQRSQFRRPNIHDSIDDAKIRHF